MKSEIFRNSILAGILIAIEDYVYLNADNKVVASFLFPLALCTIILMNLNLFTGKIGFVKCTCDDISFVLKVYIGNIVGTMILLPFYRDTYVDFITIKVSQNLWNVFGESLFCGMLMYIAVTMGKRSPLYTILGVSSFLIGKCEHCVADLGYMMISHSFDTKTIIFIIVVTLGNTIGAIFLHRMFKESDSAT